MDADSFDEELAFLQSALLAHAEWSSECGSIGLPPCDEGTLERRRERYRALAREPREAAWGEQATGAISTGLPGEAPAAPGPPRAETPAEHAESAFGVEEPRRPNTPPLPEASPTVQERPPRPRETPFAPALAGARAASVPSQVSAPAQEPPRTSADPRPALAIAADASDPARALGARPATSLEDSPKQPERTSRTVWTEHLAPLTLDDDTHHRLRMLRDEVRSCTRCALHRARTETVFARGSERSGVCFVGEGPGVEEDRSGLPFVGAAGQLLDKMIHAMGFERDDVYVCNVVKCRPPKNRKPELVEVSACRDYLAEQIALLEPRVIVALGATAVQGLLGLNIGIMKLRGRWRLYRGEIPVMPTFHPAYLLRTPTAKALVWEDLKLVLDQLGLAPRGR